MKSSVSKELLGKGIKMDITERWVMTEANGGPVMKLIKHCHLPVIIGTYALKSKANSINRQCHDVWVKMLRRLFKSEHS